MDVASQCVSTISIARIITACNSAKKSTTDNYGLNFWEYMELLLLSNSAFCRPVWVTLHKTELLTSITKKKLANWPLDDYISDHNSVDRVQIFAYGGLVLSEAKFIFGFLASKSTEVIFLLSKGAAWQERRREGLPLEYFEGNANWFKAINSRAEDR